MADKSNNSVGFVSRMLGRISGGVARRPRLILWPLLIVACAAVGVTVAELKLRTGRDALIDPAADFSRSWTQYTEDFDSHGDLIVVVRTTSPDGSQIKLALDQIAARLQREPEYFRDVLYRMDLRELRAASCEPHPAECRMWLA